MTAKSSWRRYVAHAISTTKPPQSQCAPITTDAFGPWCQTHDRRMLLCKPTRTRSEKEK